MTTDDTTTPVLLIHMPFGMFDSPSLSLGLLKAGLEQRGIGCDVRYFSLHFAESIGSKAYRDILSVPPIHLIDDWIFSRALFEQKRDDLPDVLAEPNKVVKGTSDVPDWIQGVLTAREGVDPFLDECMQSISRGGYQIIGFSSSFQQNVASLALAKQIKATWPEKVIVFGGANCTGEMGLEIHRQFPFVDLVFRGEGDEEFPRLVECLLKGTELPHLHGVVLRRNGESVPLGDGALPVSDLDSLPYPNFDDYFRQLNTSTLDLSENLRLTFESSRGCWYGVKQQCAFCGLNGESMIYRSKHPDRIRQEIIHLTSHYGVQRLYAADNILDMGYFRDLIPAIAEDKPDWSIFYEVKANLTKEQLRHLKEAGIDVLQPGIENLSTNILEHINKGCTALQNVQLLKWASELGMALFWNFITNLPGEIPEDYERMLAHFPALVHLQPPDTIGPVRMDRFSPLFNEPERFGIKNIRPAAGYRNVYPFTDEVLNRLAYYFEFKYMDDQIPAEIMDRFYTAVESWQANYAPGALTSITNEDALQIYDRRPGAIQERYELRGMLKAAYAYCDAVHPIKAIHRHLRELGYAVEECNLRQLLDGWVEERLMLRDGDWYLSLAVSADDLVDPASSSYVIKEAFAGAFVELADMHRRERVDHLT